MDYTTVDTAWAARYEKATEAVKKYVEEEGVPNTFDLTRLAESAQQRDYPTADDLKNSQWPAFFPKLAYGSEHDRKLFEDAEQKRQKWNGEYRDVMAKNAKAEADRLAVVEAANQKHKDAEYQALIDRLRADYMEVPGATEASFAAILPRLVEDEQLRIMREGQSADAIARREFAANYRL